MTYSPGRNRLFDLAGAKALNTDTEEQLYHIQSIEGYRQNFHAMKQKEGEPVIHFLAHLQSQARFCEFVVNCPNDSCGRQVNYLGDIVAGQMLAELANVEYQSKILVEAGTLTPLKQTFSRLVGLETMNKSRYCLHSEYSIYRDWSRSNSLI